MSNSSREHELVKVFPNPGSMSDSMRIDFPLPQKLTLRTVLDCFTPLPEECIYVPFNIDDEAVRVSFKLPPVYENPLIGDLALGWLEVVCPDDLAREC